MAAPEGAALAVWNTPVIVRGVLLTVVRAGLFCIGRWIAVPYLFALDHARVAGHQPLSQNDLMSGRLQRPRLRPPIWAKVRRDLDRFMGRCCAGSPATLCVGRPCRRQLHHTGFALPTSPPLSATALSAMISGCRAGTYRLRLALRTVVGGGSTLARRSPCPPPSRHAVALLLFALLAPRQGAEAQPASSPYPFRATDATLVTDDRYQYVEFVLTNDSPLDITAWEVSYSLMRTDGTVRAGGHGVDVYRSLEEGCLRPDAGACAVRPGQSSRVRFKISSTNEFTRVTLEPACAIFADGSSVGTERTRSSISLTFQRRNAIWRGWKKVLSVLLAAREQAGPGEDGARVAFEELTRLQPQAGAASETQNDGHAVALMARNLRSVLDQPVASAPVLDGMIERARREIEILEKHRKARP